MLDAVPDIGGYSQSMELGTRASLLTILDRDKEAIAAATESMNNFPESQDPFFGSLFAQGRAQVLGMAGAREESLAEIERLLNTPYRFSKWLLYLDPRWDFFRDDERFNDLIRPEGAE